MPGGGRHRRRGDPQTEPRGRDRDVGHAHDVTDPVKPAFYAAPGGPLREWRPVLHPPYTAWHLAYVVIGACLAPKVDWTVLGLTVLAFALALGLGAHALDEWHGRPLGTTIPGSLLVAVAVGSVAAACAIGIVVSASTTWWLLVTIAIGAALVPLYNLELFGGVIHHDLGFGLAWAHFRSSPPTWPRRRR